LYHIKNKFDALQTAKYNINL